MKHTLPSFPFHQSTLHSFPFLSFNPNGVLVIARNSSKALSVHKYQAQIPYFLLIICVCALNYPAVLVSSKAKCFLREEKDVQACLGN